MQGNYSYMLKKEPSSFAPGDNIVDIENEIDCYLFSEYLDKHDIGECVGYSQAEPIGHDEEYHASKPMQDRYEGDAQRIANQACRYHEVRINTAMNKKLSLNKNEETKQGFRFDR